MAEILVYVLGTRPLDFHFRPRRCMRIKDRFCGSQGFMEGIIFIIYVDDLPGSSRYGYVTIPLDDK